MAYPYTSRRLLPTSIPIRIVQLSRTYFCHCASRTGFCLACLGCAALSTDGHTGAEGCAGAAPYSLLLLASRASTLSCRSPCPLTRDVPLAKNPSTGTAQQRLFLVLKVVLHAVVVILEVLRLST